MRQLCTCLPLLVVRAPPCCYMYEVGNIYIYILYVCLIPNAAGNENMQFNVPEIYVSWDDDDDGDDVMRSCVHVAFLTACLIG